MEGSNNNNKGTVKRMSIYLGSIAFLLILFFILVIYFSSPTSPQKYSSIEQADTTIYKSLGQIEILNSDLYQIERLLEHYESTPEINSKKIELFLSNYQGVLSKVNSIRENISNNSDYNNKLKSYFVETIDEIGKTSKIVFNRLNQIPIASPLDKKENKLFIVSKFGMRNHPIYHIMKMHTGIDLRAKVGSHILATASGRVISNGNKGGYGYSCEIRHKSGYSTIYAHMVRTTVNKGKWVNKGDEIGFVGSTGLSEGPHLHYEIRKDNKPINPVPYIFENMTLEEYQKWLGK